jgi:hypothetical protein
MALALNADLNGRLASLVPVDMSPNVEAIEDQWVKSLVPSSHVGTTATPRA